MSSEVEGYEGSSEGLALDRLLASLHLTHQIATDYPFAKITITQSKLIFGDTPQVRQQINLRKYDKRTESIQLT